MRIERYYSSVREDMANLHPSAVALLDRSDYVGFFKACGPTYVRGIRRVQEVSAFLMFNSGSEETSTEYYQHAKVCSWLPTEETRESTKFTAITNSLEIKIFGYGLGLSENGSETLVAQSMAEYQQVMTFAFRTMTQVPNKNHIGMVYGMEVVPWVENSSFQVASRVLDTTIEIPLARSLIPLAFRSDGTSAAYSEAERVNFECASTSHQIDKFGYCCAAGDLYDMTIREYLADGVLTNKMCKPLRQLDANMIKDNLAANGEFIARLDRAVRYKLNQMNTLEKCISAARAIPERYDWYLLKNKDQVKTDGMEMRFTLFELKNALDPFNDYAVLRSTSKELDEFLDMYVRPCLASLYGAGFDIQRGSDASFLMAYPWHAHDSCTKLSCLGSGMRWDRSNPNGGCVPGLMAGTTAKNFIMSPGGLDSAENCSKTTSSSATTLECKHQTALLAMDFEKTKQCWDVSMPAGRVDYYINAFCMPDITHDLLDPESANDLYKKYLQGCKRLSTIERNISKGKPAAQDATGYNGDAMRAVDGRTDGHYWHNSVTHTRNESSKHWWEVYLGQDYMIKKIVVHNRSDSHQSRIRGFTITGYNLDLTQIASSSQSDPPNYFGTAATFTISPTTDTTQLKSGSTDYHNNNDVMTKYEYEVSTLSAEKTAAKIRIEKTSGSPLSLAEVEVFTEELYTALTFKKKLLFGEYLFSPNFKNFFTIESDGNLALYVTSSSGVVERKYSTTLSAVLGTDELAGYAEIVGGALQVYVYLASGATESRYTEDLAGFSMAGEYLHVTDDGAGGIYEKEDSGTLTYTFPDP